MALSYALDGECPRCCGESYFADPTTPCDGRLPGGAICGYVAQDTTSSASRQHYIDTGEYLPGGDDAAR